MPNEINPVPWQSSLPPQTRECIDAYASQLDRLLAPFGINVSAEIELMGHLPGAWRAEFRFVFKDRTVQPPLKYGGRHFFPSWEILDARFEKRLLGIALETTIKFVKLVAKTKEGEAPDHPTIVEKTNEPTQTANDSAFDYPALLKALLVDEYGKSPEEAERLLKKHTRIVTHGIMSGLTFSSIRTAAMAIEMAESEEIK